MKRVILLSPPTVRILLAAGVLLGLVGVVWIMSGMPAPRESNRVGPKTGEFSIIRPPDWEGGVVYQPTDKFYTTTIDFTPIKMVGRLRHFFIGQFRSAPDPQQLRDAMKPTTFQGREAWVYSQMGKHDYTYRLLFA